MFRVGIAEAHIAEFDLSAALLPDISIAVLNGRLRIQHLIDSFRSHRRSGQKNKDHDQHHKGHNNLHRVLGEHDHLGKQRELIAHGRFLNQKRSDPVDRQRQTTHDQLDSRREETHNPVGKQLGSFQIIVGFLEFRLLITLRVVGPDDLQPRQILPGYPV